MESSESKNVQEPWREQETVAAKAPTESSLNEIPMSDISTQTTDSPKSDIKREKKLRLRVEPEKAVVQVSPADQRVLNIINSYGDLTMDHANTINDYNSNKDGLRIFANFQGGLVPNEWFQKDFVKLISKKKFLGLRHFNALHQVVASEESFVAIECSSDAAPDELLKWIQHSDPKLTVLLYGDIAFMLNLSTSEIWGHVVPLNFVATKYDVQRWTKDDTAEEVNKVLYTSGGIPAVARGMCYTLLPSDSFTLPLDVPWSKHLHPREHQKITNEEYQGVFSRLFVYGAKGPMRSDWKFGVVPFTEIARACCFLLPLSHNSQVHSDGTEASTSSRQGDTVSSLGTQQESQQGSQVDRQLSGAASQHVEVQATLKSPSEVCVVIPKLLLERYIADNPSFRDFMPEGRVSWTTMKEVACRNMVALPTAPVSTYGEHFSFLAHSFISGLKHNIGSNITFPRVLGWPQRYTHLELLSSMDSIGRRDWPAVMRDLCKMATEVALGRVPKNASNGPDYMAVIDADHVLCMQFKPGAELISYMQMLSDLARCPLVQMKGNNNSDMHMNFSGQFKLTFIYAAMSFQKIEKEIDSQQMTRDRVERNDGYYRLDHQVDDCIPENVEVIMLREPGLCRLLGKEHYQHIQHLEKIHEEDFDKFAEHFRKYQRATNTTAQTTRNVIKMMQLLFPEWVDNLTSETLQDLADKFSPEIGELEVMIEKKPGPKPAVAQVNQAVGPLSGLVGQTRTISRRNDEDAEQSPSPAKKAKTDGTANEPK